jgi:hypothetical protein
MRVAFLLLASESPVGAGWAKQAFFGGDLPAQPLGKIHQLYREDQICRLSGYAIIDSAPGGTKGALSS